MNQKLTKDEYDRIKEWYSYKHESVESKIIAKLISHIAALEEENEKLKACLCSLESVVTKTIPYIDGLCVFGHIHGQKYLGPSWEKELKSARKLLNIKIDDL